MFKYNKTRTEAAFEKEKVGRPRDHEAFKGVSMYHTTVSHIYDHSVKFFIIRKESLIFFIVMGHMFLYSLI